MYTEGVLNEIEQSAENNIMIERERFLNFFMAIEEFVSNHKLILGGESSLRLTLGGGIKLDSFYYDIYSETPENDIKLLADIFFKIEMGKYTYVIEKVPKTTYVIFVDERELASMNLMPTTVITTTVKGAFLEVDMLAFDSQLQAIDLLFSLIDPAAADKWSDKFAMLQSLNMEEVAEVMKITHSQIISVAMTILVNKYATLDDVVIIGERAIKHDRLPKRLQVITTRSLEVEKIELEKLLEKFTIKFAIANLNIPFERRLTKLTLAVIDGNFSETILDVFDMGNYRLIPYIGSNYGSPLLIFLFKLIDIWTIHNMAFTGKIQKKYADLIIKFHIITYQEALEIILTAKISDLFPLTYMGKYLDYELMLKRKMLKYDLMHYYPLTA